MHEQPQGERKDLLEKVPRAPYPGLRPFLDYEGMLMYGRRSQAAEVVERLGSAAFVAVIGGSGSGKSSLIRAGVVPHLRQYGIPRVGDVWVPIVVTPGTNAAVTASGKAGQTPITRLAWKFEHALKGEPSAARRDDIAALLRRPGGFRQLLDAYAGELAVDGVSPGAACFLFVIDQFEELFDKSNSAVADAGLLIERVIDHYHQSKLGTGPGRCFLALTMRSEHLNDCAGCLALPEAINAGSYLVSRLDEAQLRDAIEKPANRFLRLRQRQDRKARLPDAVVFQPAVVARLVADAGRIAHDPDHLPLLQHALARVWDEACRREKVGPQGVPAEIRWDDLLNSATAGKPLSLSDQDNVLRRSLDDWAEHIFARHTPEQQRRIELLLLRLGFRDLSAGTYNQQRIEVDEYEGGRQALWALVDQGLVGDVNYLFWDDENPERVTLKVSHESFIRGWSRFRRLVDEAALRLEQFAVMMKACREWIDEGENDGALLEPRQLRRMKDTGVDAALAVAVRPDAAGAREWRQLCKGLRHVAGHENLGELPPAKVMAFYVRSTNAQEHAQRRNRRLALTLAALVGCVVPAAFFVFVLQIPALDRAMALLDVSGAANRARDPGNSYSTAGGAQFDLAKLLTIVETFENARNGKGKRAALSNALLHSPPLSWFELRLGSIPFKASSTVEPMINAKLRATMSKAVWRIAPELPKDEAQIIDRSSNEPLAVDCGNLKGKLTPVEGAREGDPSRRGIFVTDEDPRERGKYGNRLVFGAALRAGGACELGDQVLALPADRDPALLFDASLSYLLLALGGSEDQLATVSVHPIEWSNPDSGERASVRPALTTVVDEAASQAVRQQSRRSMVEPDSWRVNGGGAIRVGDKAWRVVSEQATRLVPDPQPSELQPLAPAGADPVCDALASYVDTQDKANQSGGFRTRGHRDGDYCIVLSRGVAPVDTAKADDMPRFRGIDGGAEAAAAREAVVLRSYARPPALEDKTPGVSSATPIAIIELGNYRPSEEAWYVGKPGSRFAGWIALRREADARSQLRFVGAPWGTDALARLAAELLIGQKRAMGNPGAGGAPASLPASAAAKGS